jgi:hypothetical protein
MTFSTVAMLGDPHINRHKGNIHFISASPRCEYQAKYYTHTHTHIKMLRIFLWTHYFC